MKRRTLLRALAAAPVAAPAVAKGMVTGESVIDIPRFYGPSTMPRSVGYAGSLDTVRFIPNIIDDQLHYLKEQIRIYEKRSLPRIVRQEYRALGCEDRLRLSAKAQHKNKSSLRRYRKHIPHYHTCMENLESGEPLILKCVPRST